VKETHAIDLQELWRCEGARAAVPLDASWCHNPAPDFIGPLTAPMALWFARGRPKSAWEIAAADRAMSRAGQMDLFETAAA
jgi:hypothetical protein